MLKAKQLRVKLKKSKQKQTILFFFKYHPYLLPLFICHPAGEACLPVGRDLNTTIPNN